jgi:hypothetical protein
VNQCFNGDELVQAERNKWSFLTGRRIWAFGFNAKEIALFLNSIPGPVCNAFASLLSEHEILLQQRTSQHQWLQQTCGVDILSHPNTQSKGLDAALWQYQNACGYLGVFFDPSTQTRNEVTLNSSFSTVTGVHTEELLARFANHDLEMFCPPLDFLFFCANDTIFGLESRDRYIRYMPRAGDGVRRTTLVCNSTKRLFDAAGRIKQVKINAGSGRNWNLSPHKWDNVGVLYSSGKPFS